MCVYCLTLSNLKPFNITHLFQGSVITFNPQCWSWIILNSPQPITSSSVSVGLDTA
jgi:hypothetical protein